MGWRAEIILSSTEDGWFHVEANVIGGSVDDAMAGADYILETMVSEKEAFIRRVPNAEDFTDFDTKITVSKGYVRFSYRNEIGKRHYPPSEDTVTDPTVIY